MSMPFLGQDWRSPGEQWVRTSEGWERLLLWRLKLFENLNENVLARILKLTSLEDLLIHKEMKADPSQPHISVTKVTSREKKMQTSLSESMTRLDMCGAAKDLHRFNYVCKLLEFLVCHKLCSLSGAAQKAIFTILEELIKNVSCSRNNIKTVRHLLVALQTGLKEGIYHHVGSSSLWLRHMEVVQGMINNMNELQVKERSDDGKLTMSDLPDDCLREILLRLNHHSDLIHTGLTEVRTSQLAQDRNLWRNLCLFHFTGAQWNSILKRGEDLESIGWMKLYNRLVKRYGLKDVFAEMLYLCKNCNTIYWEHHGHPCHTPKQPPHSVPVSPDMYVELFTA